MEYREYRHIDKSVWPERGPWDDEPDKIQFEDEATKLPCLIVRGPHGGLCGYVGVAEGHPFFGKEYDSCDPWPRVHGGLTFSSFCAEDGKEHGICHTPGPGEPDRVWWLGFDCAHSGDISPKYDRRERFDGYGTYKALGYVKAECARLAEQLSKVAKGESIEDYE